MSKSTDTYKNNYKLDFKLIKMNHKINKLKNTNKIKKCYKAYLRIIQLIKDKEELYYKKIYAETLKSIGLIQYKNLIKPLKAIPYLLDSLSIYYDVNPNSQSVYELYHTLYDCYLEVGNTNEIIYYGEKTLENNTFDVKTKRNVLASLGRFYLLKYLNSFLISHLIKGLSYSSQALELFKNMKNDSILDYINCLYDCGEICLYLDDLNLALKYFEEILILNSTCTIPNNILMGLYTNLTHIYSLKGYKESELLYNRKLIELEK